VNGGGDVQTRQTRKRLATRQSISDAATRLFFKRGFDQVTIDEIAEAADVSRMTVFNHFSRKEDMFFDLDEEARKAVLHALETRASGVSPVEALGVFVRRAVLDGHPYANVLEPDSYKFVATIRASEALKARARAIRDELSDLLADALARCVKRPKSDPAAALAASLLVATWTVGLNEAHRAYEQHKSVAQAKRAFVKLVDRGTRGVQSALAGTAYVRPAGRLRVTRNPPVRAAALR
jgi:AcrR family transcriptional regulator